MNDTIVSMDIAFTLFDLLKSFAMPLLAVFLGAKLAYNYQLNQYTKQKLEKEFEDILKAYLILISQVNHIARIAMQFSNEIVSTKEIVLTCFDYRRATPLDDSNLHCIVMSEPDLYKKIQEASSKYDLTLRYIDYFNEYVNKRDVSNALFTLHEILEKALDTIAHDQEVAKEIYNFVTEKYKKSKFLTFKLDRFEFDTVKSKLALVKSQINISETSYTEE